MSTIVVEIVFLDNRLRPGTAVVSQLSIVHIEGEKKEAKIVKPRVPPLDPAFPRGDNVTGDFLAGSLEIETWHNR